MYDEIMEDEKSRFCFNPLAQTQRIWSSLPELNIPIEDQRVASQWSVLARDHVNLTLRNLHTLNEWTQTSVAKVVKNGFNRGSADEKLLPTFLQTLAGEEAFSTCDSNPDKMSGCCTTYVEWKTMKPSENTLIPSLGSDKCKGAVGSHPCTYLEVTLRNLIELRRAGFLFLRKVADDAVWVPEEEEQKNGRQLGAGSSLIDGLVAHW